MIEHVLPWAHPSTTQMRPDSFLKYRRYINHLLTYLLTYLLTNGKSIGSAIFAQLTAESPYSLQWAPFPTKLPLSTGDLDPHLIHGSMGPP